LAPIGPLYKEMPKTIGSLVESEKLKGGWVLKGQGKKSFLGGEKVNIL